jgi:hypothetical protein
MPYQINKFNGDPLVVLEDGTLDSTTSVGLVGKNFAGYGEIQNENFLWLLENFAGENAPGRPLTGQLWFNATEGRIKVYSSGAWNTIGGVEISSTQPTTPAAGDQWLDGNKKLYVYTGTEWQFIGPETVLGFGDTRLISAKVRDISGNYWPIIKATLNNTVVAIFAERDFEINSLDAVVGFTNLKKGITVSTTSVFNGQVNGNATTSTTLETARNINGVAFNGSTDITVNAVSPNPLIPGDHLSGSNYTGASSVTWSVEASSNNLDDTIVKRDGNGNFSASTITANNFVGTITGTSSVTVFGDVQGDVVGNLQGNVTGNVTGSLTGNVTGNLTGNVTGNLAGDHLGNVTGNVVGNITGDVSGNSTTATRLQTPRTINGEQFDGTGNITIVDNTKLPISGGTLTGLLTLAADPTSNLDAATKRYVDSRDAVVLAGAIAAIPAAFTFTYGNTTYSQSGFTNQVGSWNFGANFFDVFPPAGKTIASNLKAFIPSIAVIHYAGRVDGNDSLVCTWSNLGDRIRVYVQNTEQRSTPAANWLAIWS